MITWLVRNCLLKIVLASSGPQPRSGSSSPGSPSRSASRSRSQSSTTSSASLPLSADDRDWPDWALRPADAGVVYQCHYCGPAWRVQWSPVDRHGDTILAYYRHLSRHGAAATVEALERVVFEQMMREEGLA